VTTPSFDLTPFLGRDEGQQFDRKSMFEGEAGKKRPRDRRSVREQVAQLVAGFANAEGGVLILGIEDDHSVTGHQLPPDALAAEPVDRHRASDVVPIIAAPAPPLGKHGQAPPLARRSGARAWPAVSDVRGAMSAPLSSAPLSSA